MVDRKRLTHHLIVSICLCKKDNTFKDYEIIFTRAREKFDPHSIRFRRWKDVKDKDKAAFGFKNWQREAKYGSKFKDFIIMVKTVYIQSKQNKTLLFALL